MAQERYYGKTEEAAPLSKATQILSIIYSDLINEKEHIIEKNSSSNTINLYDKVPVKYSMYQKKGVLLYTIKIAEKTDSAFYIIQSENPFYANLNLSEILSNNAIKQIQQVDSTFPVAVKSSPSCPSHK